MAFRIFPSIFAVFLTLRHVLMQFNNLGTQRFCIARLNAPARLCLFKNACKHAGLIEKAEQSLDEKKAAELEKKLRKNKFDLNDLLDQLQQVRKMGSMKDLLSMLPGVGNKLRDVDIDERQFDRVQAIIRSMTPEERAKPEIINPSRKRRIAAGCGMQVEDVNKLLAQHRQMLKMFKQMNSKSTRRRFSRMGNFGNFGGM